MKAQMDGALFSGTEPQLWSRQPL